MRFTAICALLSLALLTNCAPRQDTASTETATPSPTLAPTATPTAAMLASTPAAAATPTAAATLSPTASASLTPVPVAAPAVAPSSDPSAPLILALNIDKTDVRAGDTVSGTIVTSLSVASVEARIAGFGITVPKVAPGRFALSYTVPDVPFFLRHSYPMDIIARNTAGAAVRRSVTINVR